MSLSDILTAHADAFRQKTGVIKELSLTDMTELLNDLSWNKVNLLKGTSNQYKELKGFGWLAVSTASEFIVPASLGETFTYTANINNTFGDTLNLQLYERDSKNNRKYLGASGNVFPGEEKEVSVTETVNSKDCQYIEAAIWAANHQKQTHSFYVKDERLYMGTEPGIWTPNPADKVGGVVNFVLTAAFERRCAA